VALFLIIAGPQDGRPGQRLGENVESRCPAGPPITHVGAGGFRRSRSGRYGTPAVSAETPESELARHVKEMNPLSAKAICDGRGVAKPERRMGRSVAASILVLIAMPALAAELPSRKPGQWEITMTLENRNVPAPGLMVQRSGNVITIDSTCTVGGKPSTSHAVITGSFDSAYGFGGIYERMSMRDGWHSTASSPFAVTNRSCRAAIWMAQAVRSHLLAHGPS
jgi:hypothetical protein